jgi:hypothetical protein
MFAKKKFKKATGVKNVIGTHAKIARKNVNFIMSLA